MTYQHDAHRSSRIVLTAFPVLGLVLLLAGCLALPGRQHSRLGDSIRSKERQRARMERHMKPPLPESGLAVWWKSNGDTTMGILAAVLGIGGVANRVKGIYHG